jgi:plastocyanin
LRFNVNGSHQVAVYKVAAGTTRAQVTAAPDTFVNTTVNSPFDNRDIGDATNRVALGPSPRAVDTAAADRDDALNMDVTINEAGKYLVICAVRGHFLDKDPASNGGMFGFVEIGKPLTGETLADLTAPVGEDADVTVRFGDPRFLGSGDRRNRSIVPSTVEVKAGATVRFQVGGNHQVAVYKAPADATRQAVAANRGAFVNTTVNGLFDMRDIGDTTNRVVLGASPRTVDTAIVNQSDATNTDVTITVPGRYLVICAIRSHYMDDDPLANGGMFGFLDVR